MQSFHTKQFPLHYQNSYPNFDKIKFAYNETLMCAIFAFLHAFINRYDYNIIVTLSNPTTLNNYQHSELSSDSNASDNICNRYNFTCKT